MTQRKQENRRIPHLALRKEIAQWANAEEAVKHHRRIVANGFSMLAGKVRVRALASVADLAPTTVSRVLRGDLVISSTHAQLLADLISSGKFYV